MDFGITNPHETEFTISITMELGEWIGLSEQLGRDYPSWKLAAAITDVVARARSIFTPDTPEKLDVCDSADPMISMSTTRARRPGGH